MASLRQEEERVLESCRRHPNGMEASDISRELGLSLEAVVEAINLLARIKRLSMHRLGDKVLYKEVAAEEAAKFKGLTTEELMVYQHIKTAGNMGIWTKDLRIRTNLAQPQVTKFLKALEARRLIKGVKNVNNPSRKVYMLQELEPSRELTGGAWYTENQFDHEFIEVLRTAAYRFIEQEGDTTIPRITQYIKTTGLSKVDLRDEEIRQIVRTLVYDNRVSEVEPDNDNDDQDHYRPVVMGVPETTALTSLPCGVCPVFEKCYDGGVISPQTCVYYNQWLEF